MLVYMFSTAVLIIIVMWINRSCKFVFLPTRGMHGIYVALLFAMLVIVAVDSILCTIIELESTCQDHTYTKLEKIPSRIHRARNLYFK